MVFIFVVKDKDLANYFLWSKWSCTLLTKHGLLVMMLTSSQFSPAFNVSLSFPGSSYKTIADSQLLSTHFLVLREVPVKQTFFPGLPVLFCFVFSLPIHNLYKKSCLKVCPDLPRVLNRFPKQSLRCFSSLPTSQAHHHSGKCFLRQ